MILITFYVLFPAFLLYLRRKFPIVDKIGPILLSYLAGIILGNTGIIPAGFSGIQNTLSEVTIVISLPLLLFSMNVKQWFKVAGKAIVSMLLATISIVAISLLLYLWYKDFRSDAWQLSGMAIGLYTGGTPNIAAIKAALQIDNTTYLLFHTYDLVIGVFYVLFFITGAQALFNKFLKPYPKNIEIERLALQNEEILEKKEAFRKEHILPLFVTFLLSLGIVGLSAGIGSFLPKTISTAAIILLITTFGIASSFSEKIRSVKFSFDAGMYIIYIFSIVVASMADLKQLANINWGIMSFIILAILGSILLHAIFCKLLDVDTDTFIITSVAAICSPPFVPVVASALKNKTIILSGLTTGIIGYAIGNYLGISLAYLFHLI